MKILFVNDSTSSSNWGDRAAAVALMAMVRARGGEIIYRVTEQNLWDAWFAERSSGLTDETTENRTRDLARRWLAPVALDARRWLLKRRDDVGQDQLRLIPDTWEAYPSSADRVLREPGYGWPVLFRSMEHADAMVIHGASLHGDLYVARAILFLTYLMKTRFGKPVVIANHTSGLKGALLRTADHVYPLFDDVVYRDPISAERWAGVYGGRFAADSAFLFEPAERKRWNEVTARATYFDVWPDTAAFDPAQPYICVGGSAIFHDRKDWGSLVEGYTALVKELQSVYSGAIVLTASADLDEPLLRELAARFCLPMVGVNTPIQQAVDIIGNADAYVGGRWHPCIFAMRGGAPLVPLSSQTVKMRAIAALAEAPEPFDTLDLKRAAPAIGRQLALSLEAGDVLRVRLAEAARRLAETSWDNVSYLSLLHGGPAGMETRAPDSG